MSEADNRRIVEEAIAALNAHDIDRYLKCGRAGNRNVSTREK